MYKALLTSADISKCCTETQPKTLNSKQCKYRSTIKPKVQKNKQKHMAYGYPRLQRSVLFCIATEEQEMGPRH
jgi:hypothetical protein